MTYLEWNTAIADRFFSDSVSGQRVFLCVTRDTLAEISQLDPEPAVHDFVQAIKAGPGWTQVPGCSSIGSKARNCLYPDPCWPARGPRATEKKNLTEHDHWGAFPETASGKPPYLAYLACFVLAWTERPADFNGNDYYGPLNNLLGLHGNEQVNSCDFGPYYHFGAKKISTNVLWEDLEKWGYENNTGVCHLPQSLVERPGYVEIPKYFGLLKAADMKSLARLFALLEEGGTLESGRVPVPASMVGAICESPVSSGILSNACLSNLREARQSGDPAMMEAYGGLLCAKYRDFDGFSEETSGAGAEGISGCRARLLRVLDRAGKVRMVCRLRRDNAWEKLPLEEGEAYTFMLAGAEGHPRIAKWIANSPWFGLMDMAGSNPLAGLHTRCAELSLAAQLAAREIVAMRNWGLPFHLQGTFLEVDEVEHGKDYVLLVPGSAAPGFAGLFFTRVQWNVPAGFSCWKIRVPENQVIWPAELPPIVDDKPHQPSIRLEGFRLEPRSNRFPLQFSPTVQSSDDTHEVFITWQADRVGAVLASGNGGWVLSAQGEGKVRLALRGVVGHAEVAGSLREVEFNDVSQKSPCACTDLLIASNGASLPPCPSARISLQGGTPDPRIPGNPLAFLASDPPMVSVELSAALGDGLEFFVNGNLLRCFPLHPTSLLPANTLGTVQLECRHRGIPLDLKGVSLSSNPKVDVSGLSGDKDKPMTVSDTIVATVFGGGDQDERVNVGYRIMDGNSTVKKGAIHSPFEGIITYASKANLRADHAYRLEFTVGNDVVARRWFKVRPGAGHNSPGSRRPQGFNSLANAFDNLQLPGSGEQGHA